MRIAFLTGGCVPFHGRTLDERPLGGTETAVIRLAEALLDRGHRVFVFGPVERPPVTDVAYLPYRSLDVAPPPDVLVVVRDWRLARVPVRSAARFFWTGDAADQFATFGLGDRRVIGRLDGVLFVSEWHARTLGGAAGVPEEKRFVLRNGVHAPYFDVEDAPGADPLLAVYTSTPYRGLGHLARLWPAIRGRAPGARLEVYGGYDVYRTGREPVAGEGDADRALREELAALPGVSVTGNVVQRELARRLLGASVLAYPNTFAETSCISVLEARAAGLSVVTTDRGALGEAVGADDVLVRGEPGEETYDRIFVDAVVSRLDLSDPGRRRDARTSFIRANDWGVRAADAEAIFSSVCLKKRPDLSHGDAGVPARSSLE